MKSLSSSSFFRVFDLLIGISNPGLKLDQWKVADVNIGRERHSFSGGLHCFTIEIFFLAQPGRRGWELIVAKEHWWNAGHQRPLKTLRWSQLTIGSRKDIMAWLREREREIERRTSTS